MRKRALFSTAVLLSFASFGVLGLMGCSGDDAKAAATAGTSGGAGSAGGAGAGGGGGAITYHENVESILQHKCQTCHQDGGIAGFSLTSYKQVKAYGPIILPQIQSRAMPPWGAFDTDDCTHKRPFRDDHRLTDDEIDLITKWHEQGALEGDPAKAPAPIDLSPPALDNVTASLSPTNEYFLQAGQQDDFRCFIIDPKLTEDTFIDGTSVVPGDPRVVHHVLVFSDPDRASLALDEGNGNYGCFGGPNIDGPLMMAWAPGIQPNDFSPNALKLKKDSLLVMQVHYHRLATEDVQERTTIELRATDKTPAYVAQMYLIGNFPGQDSDGMGLQPDPDDRNGTPEFRIPANATEHHEEQVFEMPAGVPPLPLAAIGTHMHWVGYDMQISVERKNPTDENPAKECLLETPKYDFNWQRAYWYDTPVDELPTLEGGDRLRMTCKYNNTMTNDKVVKALSEEHLSAPKDVELGETTLDEMCLGAFVILVPPAFAD